MPGSSPACAPSSNPTGCAVEPGEEIGLKIDQTLTQDATGTLVMLEFEALGIPRVRTELSAQYVDHNLFQEEAVSTTKCNTKLMNRTSFRLPEPP